MGKEAPPSAEGLTPGGPEDSGPGGPEDSGPAAATTGEGLIRSTAAMAVGTTLSRATGFLRVASMAFALGVAETRLADAYNVANNVPNIVYELILGGILTSIFVPVFVHRLAERGRDEAWRSAQAVMTVAVIVLAAVMVVGIVAAPWIVKLYTIRVPAADRPAVQELATLFLRFFMPQIVLYGVGAVATGLLNAHRRFAVPMFVPVLNNLIAVGAFVTFAVLPVPGPGAPSPENISVLQKLVLGAGTTAGVAAMTLALWPSLRALGFRLRWRTDWRDPAVRSLVRLSGWAVFYVVMNQLGLLVVIVLAGGVPGGYTAYQAAFIFFQLPHAIFSVSIMTALLPSLSEAWTRGDRRSFRAELARGIRGSAFVVVPAAAGYLVLARPIVRLLLEHGVAGSASTNLVSSVLVFFALGLFSFSAFLLFLRAFYAMRDTRTPAMINLFAVGLNVVLNLALFPVLQVEGLALAHAVAYTFAAITAAVVLRRRLGGLEGRAVASGLTKIGIAAATVAAAAWGAARAMTAALGTATLAAQAAIVVAGVVAGMLVFLAAAAILRMEEFDLLKRTLLRRATT